MARRVFLDIETIPTTDPEEMARIAVTVLAHNATLKKPHEADEVKRLVDEAHRKTSLDGAFGEVVVIAVALDDGPTTSWSRDFRDRTSEAKMLQQFAADIATQVGRAPDVIGHNVIDFDKPFLRQRGLVHGVRLPRFLTASSKPWEATDLDTMLMWTQGQRGKFIGLDRLARALGVGCKSEGLDGSKVWDAVQAGKIDDVVRYCIADVELTRKVYARMTQPDAEG